MSGAERSESVPYGPPHLTAEWAALTVAEQTAVQRWFTERKALTEAERVLDGKTCASGDHEDYPAWSVGIYNDGSFMDTQVYYCRECTRLLAGRDFTPLIMLSEDASLKRGLADSAAGRVHNLGSFEQYADEPSDDASQVTP